jgi:hypothetical protein
LLVSLSEQIFLKEKKRENERKIKLRFLNFKQIFKQKMDKNSKKRNKSTKKAAPE